MTMRRFLFTFVFILCIIPSTSCAQRSIYDSLWKVEEYFEDPQLIALCKAIDKEDMVEIDRLVAAGADVNARGKDGMTPLLWAYGSGEKALEKVLQLGADPNTVFNHDFKSRGVIDPGDTLLFVAMKSTAPSTWYPEKFQNYVDILLKYGADPNWVQERLKTVPLRNAIRFNNVEAARKLIQAGADVDFRIDGKNPLVKYAASTRSFDVMLELLRKGADYRSMDPRNGLTAIQLLGSHADFLDDPSKTGQDFREVVEWMKTRGMSIDRAKEQWELWQKTPMHSGDPDGNLQKYIKEVIEPENARLLPPGVDPPKNMPVVQPVLPVVQPPAARQGNVFVPVVIALVVLVFLAGGIWFWTQKRGKIAS